MKLDAVPPATRAGFSFSPLAKGGRKSAPALLLLAAAFAQASDLDISLRHAVDGGRNEGYGLALRFGAWWSKDLNGYQAVLRPELEFNHFRHSAPTAGPKTLDEGGGIALLRLQRPAGGWRPYGEIGLGLALFSRDRLGTKGFSTPYQFSEHLGLGMDFSGKWFAGWRYSHYSNAGIKTPNDGLDLHQALIGVRF